MLLRRALRKCPQLPHVIEGRQLAGYDWLASVLCFKIWSVIRAHSKSDTFNFWVSEYFVAPATCVVDGNINVGGIHFLQVKFLCLQPLNNKYLPRNFSTTPKIMLSNISFKNVCIYPLFKLLYYTVTLSATICASSAWMYAPYINLNFALKILLLFAIDCV